jgi:hypothetical protein
VEGRATDSETRMKNSTKTEEKKTPGSGEARLVRRTTTGDEKKER